MEWPKLVVEAIGLELTEDEVFERCAWDDTTHIMGAGTTGAAMRIYDGSG